LFVLFVLVDALVRAAARFATFVRFFVELGAALAFLERLWASFDEARFSFDLTAALLRLALDPPLTAPPRVTRTVVVILCF
jgi:hypothetical protein